MEYYTKVTLIEKIKNSGSRESWESFISIYTPYIKAIIINSGVTEGDIDDLTQMVFITCWEKLPEFEYDSEKGKFRYWLCRITKWICNNHLRKIARRTRILAENFVPDELNLECEVEQLADSEWKRFISHKAWANVQQTLSVSMATCYEQYLAGEKLSDIAAQMEVGESSVKVYLSRIEKKIVTEIQKLLLELE